MLINILFVLSVFTLFFAVAIFYAAVTGDSKKCCNKGKSCRKKDGDKNGLGPLSY